MMLRLLLIALVISSSIKQNDALFDWLFGSKTEDGVKDDVDEIPMPLAVKLAKQKQGNAPFEMKTADEKFLASAAGNELLRLSPQDVCQHTVIGKLKTACSKLTEEQIGKIAVQLMNCQSKAENRQVYPCTDDMEIGDCTRDMDSTTWNSYQIVSNRARAICYSTQQQQFRMRTEHTIAKLSHNTEEQLLAVQHIQEGQEKVAEVTSDTLKKMYEGQQELMGRQELLKSAHNDIQLYIASNLQELTREKALIATGNKELADMTDGIRQRLDRVTSQLFEQEAAQHDNHAEVLEDLAIIQQKAKDVWQKIETSSKHVLQFQNETTEQYKRTLSDLEKVNQTINFVMKAVTGMQKGLDKKLGWIAGLVGQSEDKLRLLTVVSLHVVYFFLAALLVSFLQTPWFTRFVLLVSVPLNAYASVRHKSCLDFPAMTLLIVLTTFANWFVNTVVSVTSHFSSRPKESKRVEASPTPLSPVLCLPNKATSPLQSPLQTMSKKDLKKLAYTIRKIIRKEKSSATSTPNISCISVDSAFDPTGGSTLSDTSSITQTANSSQISHLTEVNDTSILSNTTEIPDQSATFDATENDTKVVEIEQQTVDLELVRKRLLEHLDEHPSQMGPSSCPNSPRRSPRNLSRNTSASCSVLSTPTKRPQCAAMTNSGLGCKNKSSPGIIFCHRHSNKSEL